LKNLKKPMSKKDRGILLSSYPFGPSVSKEWSKNWSDPLDAQLKVRQAAMDVLTKQAKAEKDLQDKQGYIGRDHRSPSQKKYDEEFPEDLKEITQSWEFAEDLRRRHEGELEIEIELD